MGHFERMLLTEHAPCLPNISLTSSGLRLAAVLEVVGQAFRGFVDDAFDGCPATEGD